MLAEGIAAENYTFSSQTKQINQIYICWALAWHYSLTYIKKTTGTYSYPVGVKKRKKMTFCLLRVPNQTSGTEKDLIILNFCTHVKSIFVRDARAKSNGYPAITYRSLAHNRLSCTIHSQQRIPTQNDHLDLPSLILYQSLDIPVFPLFSRRQNV